jgi:hypothetical protein
LKLHQQSWKIISSHERWSIRRTAIFKRIVHYKGINIRQSPSRFCILFCEFFMFFFSVIFEVYLFLVLVKLESNRIVSKMKKSFDSIWIRFNLIWAKPFDSIKKKDLISIWFDSPATNNETIYGYTTGNGRISDSLCYGILPSWYFLMRSVNPTLNKNSRTNVLGPWKTRARNCETRKQNRLTSNPYVACPSQRRNYDIGSVYLANRFGQVRTS